MMHNQYPGQKVNPYDAGKVVIYPQVGGQPEAPVRIVSTKDPANDGLVFDPAKLASIAGEPLAYGVGGDSVYVQTERLDGVRRQYYFDDRALVRRQIGGDGLDKGKALTPGRLDDPSNAIILGQPWALTDAPNERVTAVVWPYLEGLTGEASDVYGQTNPGDMAPTQRGRQLLDAWQETH